MKKENWLLVLVIFIGVLLLPSGVLAKEKREYQEAVGEVLDCPISELEIDVCEDCEYTDLQEAIEYVWNYSGDCPVNSVKINIGEGDYLISHFGIFEIDDVDIKGAGKDKTTIVTGDYALFGGNGSLSLSDFTIKQSRKISEYGVLSFAHNYDISISNVDVDARRSPYGIYLVYNRNAIIDNTIVKNSSLAGIYKDYCSDVGAAALSESSTVDQFNMIHYENKLQVTNSDISNNGCGVVDINSCRAHAPEAGGQSLEMFSDTALNSSVATTLLKNTKLGCAAAESYSSSEVPIVYIPKDNIWTGTPIYDENVTEDGNSLVVVEYEKDKTVSLKTSEKEKIANVFSLPEGYDGEEWIVEDSSIAKVVDGEIIPLKVGNTVITTDIGNITYNINLDVVNSLVNPNTFNTTYAIVFVVIILGISSVLVIRKSKN